MASGIIYGAFSGRSTSDARPAIEWSSTSNGATANSSSVTATLVFYNYTGRSSYNTNGRSMTINIDGNSSSSVRTFDIRNKTREVVWSRTVTVAHNSNGSKSITISSSGDTGVSLGTFNFSGTATLDTIPRYTSITAFSTSSIERDRITISWSASDTCNYWWYSLNGGSTWVAVGTINASSGSRTITGLSAGTTYSLRVRVRRSSSNLTTDSGTLSRTTLAIASPNTPTLSSRTCIQAVMNWSSNRTVTGVQYRLGSGAWQTAITFTARTSGSFTITGLTPNTSYNVSVRVRDAVHGTWSGASGGRSISTFRLSTYTVPNSNTGQSITITISRASSSITHDVTLQYLSSSGTWVNWISLNNQSTSATFNPSTTQLNTLYNARPDVKNPSIRVNVVNKWNNSTVQGTNSSGQSILNIVNANPTIESVSYEDVNGAVQAILGNNQKILRNHSTLSVTAGLATSQKGATLSSYKVNIGGSEYTATASGTSQTGRVINVGKVNQSSNQTAVLTVTDSRGYTASRSFTVQMLDYAEPQFISITPERLNNYEEPSYLKAQARRTIVKPSDVDVNKMELRYRIKENPAGEYGDFIDIVSTDGNSSGIFQHRSINQYMEDYPNNQSYTIEVSIRDKFTDWKSTLSTLPEGIALLRFMKDKIVAGVPLYLNGLNVGEAVIVESGSTPNGKYIKYGDGTMVCTAYLNFSNIGINNAHGSLYRSGFLTWAFPKEFVGDRPYASAKNNITVEPCWDVGHTLYHYSYQFYLYSTVPYATRDRWLALEAVGRWK